MSCVAVTRNGTGDPWLFDSEEEAYSHPLVQYGDVVVGCPAHLVTRWPVRDLPMVVRLARLGVPGRTLEAEAEQFATAAPSPKLTQQKQEWAARVWPALVAAAQRPPADPRKILELVRKDRALHPQVSKESRMAASAEKTEKTEKTKGAKAAPFAKSETISGYPLTAKVQFGTDKEGNPYGPKNSPKREGTESATRWAGYKAGATVAKCLESGVRRSDVVHDLKKGFITLVN